MKGMLAFAGSSGSMDGVLNAISIILKSYCMKKEGGNANFVHT